MREADIRPADILAEYLRLSAADADLLFSDRSKLVLRPCPGCGRDWPRAEFTKHNFNLVRCGHCETLYVNPCPTQVQLTALYADSPSTHYWARVFFPAVAEARRSRIFAPRAEKALALASAGGATAVICEVGAGAGLFLEECRRLLPSAVLRAVEPGVELADDCRRKGFQTFEGVAAEASHDPAWANQADLVVCFEVIEHTADTPEFFASLTALAKPGGMVLVSGLCGDGFDIRVLGAKSNAVSPPHHLTFLSRNGAQRLLERCGLVDGQVFTPGELDVDIVANALKADVSIVIDPFLRGIIECADANARAAFQKFLKENGLSSHMWIIGRKAK